MRKYQYIFLPLVTGAVIVIVTVLFALPKIRTIVVLKGKLKHEKQKLSRLTQKKNLLRSFNGYELEKKADWVEKALPSRKAVAEILTVLSSLAKETDMSFVDFSVAPGKLKPEKFQKLSYKASFEGDRRKIKELSALLQESLPVMRIVSFNIKGEKGSLEIESFFSPLPKTLGKVDSPLPKISSEENKAYRKIIQFRTFDENLTPVPAGKEDIFSTL